MIFIIENIHYLSVYNKIITELIHQNLLDKPSIVLVDLY